MNLLLFFSSCGLIVLFACYFWYLGQNALTAWIAILSLMANLFILKQITLFGFNATASDIFVVGSLLGLNLLQEKFGPKAAQQAIWTSFGCLLFFTLMSYIHLHYHPSTYDQAQSAYVFLLTPTPRIVFASLFTFFIVQSFNSYLFYKLRLISYFPVLVSSAIALCLSQCLDTLLFTLLGLYGVVDALLEVMAVSLCIKLGATASTVPWSFLSRRFLASNKASA